MYRELYRHIFHKLNLNLERQAKNSLISSRFLNQKEILRVRGMHESRTVHDIAAIFLIFKKLSKKVLILFLLM